MAERTIFMTGFPGFLSRHLVARLVRKHPEDRFLFLIQEHLRERAEQAIQAQDEATPGFADRVTLMPGDITAGPELGLSQRDLSQARNANVVWHLAAIYNLAIDLPAAYAVNVTGTANVLDFCTTCDNLHRLAYISTCYVSGDRTGRVMESELDMGQGFKNHYESTKCWAEIDVRRKMEQIPTSIFRPSVVVGDSRTGETDKYDGPYYLIRALLRLPRWLPIPHIGPGKAGVNTVPVDFVVDAMAHLADMDESLGLTFHLADPKPHPNRDTLERVAKLTGHPMLKVTVPAGPVEKLAALSFVEQALQMPAEIVAYMNHDVVYDTSNTDRLLADTDIRCPDFYSYLPILVDYVRRHPNKSFLDNRRY